MRLDGSLLALPAWLGTHPVEKQGNEVLRVRFSWRFVEDRKAVDRGSDHRIHRQWSISVSAKDPPSLASLKAVDQGAAQWVDQASAILTTQLCIAMSMDRKGQGRKGRSGGPQRPEPHKSDSLQVLFWIIGDRDLTLADEVGHGGHHEVGQAGPTAVDGGLGDAASSGDVVDAQIRQARRRQEFPGCGQHARLHGCIERASTRSHGNHPVMPA